MPFFKRHYAIVEPQGRSPLHLRSHCHGSFERREAGVLATADINIPFTVASPQTAEVSRKDYERRRHAVRMTAGHATPPEGGGSVWTACLSRDAGMWPLVHRTSLAHLGTRGVLFLGLS